MIYRSQTTFRLAILAVIVLAGTTRIGVASEDHITARELQRAGKILPLDEIVMRAKQMSAGRIIEAELERSGQQYLYEIEFLDEDGTVHEMKFDAQTGALISGRRER